MIEEQLAERMRAVLADEPDLGFDPDELVDRAKRRRRSSVAAFGATGAVLVIAVAAVVATGSGDRGSEVGTTPTTTGPTVCQGVAPGRVPPLTFAGSREIVARLDRSAPGVIAAHLPGVSVLPSETGMIAYDCPPNVGTNYRVDGTDQSVMLYMIHARRELDLANDRYAGDAQYQLTNDDTAADGARIRTYQYKAGGILVVVRFGVNGMITEASVSGSGALVADSARLQALASDPELRF